MMGTTKDVAIVGAGPAGISAAIYLKRAGIDPLVFERKRIGGLLINANLVENYPGFPDGISGRDLVRLLVEQLSRIGIKVIIDEVLRVEFKDDMFHLETDQKEFIVRFLVFATGTRPKNIELKGFESLVGSKLFFEIVDITSNWKGKHFLIIGGGDAAFDYALNLAANHSKVDIIFRSRKPKCIPLLLDRAKKETRIRLLSEYIPEAVYREHDSVSLKCRSGNDKIFLRGDYVIIACGREPNLDALPARLKANTVIRPGEKEKSNLFFIGDIARESHRQLGIAVGDGIDAAMEIARRIAEGI